LKDYPAINSSLGWEVFSEGYNEQNSPAQIDVSQIAISGYPTGASGNRLKLIAEKAYAYKVVGKYGPDKISVNFVRNKKPFEINQLLAVDMNNEARKAKNGETLYLVRKNNELARSVEFRISTDAQSKNFWPNEPIWHNYTQADRDKQLAAEAQYGQRDEEYYSKSDAGFTDKTRFKARHRFDDWSETTTTSVSAFGNERKVNIKTLMEDRVKDKAALPPQIDNAINKVIGSFNTFTKHLNKISGGTFEEASIKNDFSFEYFNEAAEKSRHYYRNRNLSIGLTGTISTGEIPIPALSISLPNIVNIGAYIKPGISLRLSGGATDRRRSESETWEYYSFNIGGNLTGGVEGGVQVKLFTKGDDDPTKMTPPNWIRVEAKGYAKASVFGGFDYRRREETPPNVVRVTAGLDPLILGVSATVKISTVLLDTTLLDYSKEWYLTDRLSITDKIEF
jgi:hypothetical protein